MVYICFLPAQGSPPSCHFFKNSIDRSVKGSFGVRPSMHYICSQVSKFRDPWNNMTVGCFNAPAPHIPSWTNADTAGLFSFMFNVHVQPTKINYTVNLS